jgi:zinc and cadmium transporter
LAAGSLLGGALFHMLPQALEQSERGMLPALIWVALGFVSFFAFEQLLHWHHCHRTPSQHVQPFGYLVLFADALHNFIGGLAVAGAFLGDIRVGIAAWLAAAAHEVPQELGDFGALVHSGWSARQALLFNLLSALTFPVGGVTAYALAGVVDVSVLVPFGAGNFLYIAASDLIPEVKQHRDWRVNLLNLGMLVLGLGLLLLARFLFHAE